MKKNESQLSRRQVIKGVAQAGLASVLLPLTGFRAPNSESVLLKGEDNTQAFYDRQPVNPTDFNALAVIYTPSIIYASEGVETNIYFDNVIFSNLPNNLLDIDVSCNKGRNYEKFWRITPLSKDAGTTIFKIEVRFDGKLIATKTSQLIITSNTAGVDKSLKVLCIGDSTTAGGQYISIINTDYQSLSRPSITFLGTKGVAPTKHEGRGGWKFSQYAGNGGVTIYRFNMTGIAETPGIGSVYSNSSSEFIISEINITGGNGYVSATRNKGTSNPLISGRLTKVSGVGAALIPYTDMTMTSGNPFWNLSTQRLDFQKYLTDNQYTMSANDLITVHLGINDVFSDVSLLILDSMKADFDKLVAEFRAVIPHINIGLCITIPPSISQDAFAINYANGQTLKGYIENYKQLIEFLLTNYDTPGMRISKLYCIGFNHCIDRVNNFNKTTMIANSRSTKIIDTWANGVHPDNTGYYQMGDALYSFIKSLSR